MNDCMPSQLKSIRLFASLFVLAIAVAIPWFLLVPLHLDTFMGDDMNLWRCQQAGTLSSSVFQALTESGTEKYRPVASLLFLATYKMFDGNFHAYVLFNLISHCAMGAALGVVVARLFVRKYVIGTVFCLLFVTSRFAYYNVLQRYGIMEEWALLWISLSALFAVDFYRRGRRRSAVLASVMFFLAIYTHERYVAAAGFLALTFALSKFGSVKMRVGLAALPAVVVLSNIWVKHSLLHIHFLTGTGGFHIDFNPRPIGTFFISALADIFGFDNGSPYFSGRDFRDFGLWGFLPGAAMTVSFMAIGALYLRHFGRAASREVLIFLSLLLPLLLSASVTVRLEFRWIFASELVLIMAVFMMTAKLTARTTLLRILFSVFLAGTLAANGLARSALPNVYFVAAMREAESIRKTIVDGYARQLSARPVYTIDSMINPALIAAYSGLKTPVVLPIDSRAIAGMTQKERAKGLFFTENFGAWRVVKVPAGEGSDKDAHALLGATATDVRSIPGLLEAIQVNPGNWYFTLQIGLLFLGKNPEKAAYYFREAIRMVGTENPYPYFYLGQVFYQQRQYSDAKKYYEQAMQYDDKLHPNPSFADALAKARAASP